MAELIDKSEITKEMWWLYNNYVNNASNFEPEETEAVNRSFGRLQNVIDNMPTTTEAEIIEKFAEKLGEAFSEKSSEIKVDGMTFDILTLDSVIEIMWDLVEQVKEE